MKFVPKKVKNKKIKKHKRPAEYRPKFNDFDEIEKVFQGRDDRNYLSLELDIPQMNNDQCDRSLTSKFNPKVIEQKDFEQMAMIPDAVSKEPKVEKVIKHVKEIAIETSREKEKSEISLRYEATQKDIDNSDKDISCHLMEKYEKPVGVNAETDTGELETLMTPRHPKNVLSQDLDFHLTSSREMNKHYREIFKNDPEQLSPIDENCKASPQHKSDKSLQCEPEQEIQAKLEPKIDLEPKPESESEEQVAVEHSKSSSTPVVFDYSKTMDKALKYRERQEKEKLKNMLKNRRISDRSYKERKRGIEKWVDTEKKHISKTKNVLLQGWMKANEIIGHLEKDKRDVFYALNDRKERLSPRSHQSSNYSAFSFCRSENSIGPLNETSFSNDEKSNLNHTTDYDICNNLRRRTQQSHKNRALHMRSHSASQKAELKHGSDQNIGSMLDQLKVDYEDQIAEVSKDSTPLKPKENLGGQKHSSETLNWGGEEPESREKDTGYIDECIKDIKQYYGSPQQQDLSESEPSKSSSFHMGDGASDGDIEEHDRSPQPIGEKDKDVQGFAGIQPLSWPPKTSNTLPVDNPIEIPSPRSEQDHIELQNITDRKEAWKFADEMANPEIDMNEDLRDVSPPRTVEIPIKSRPSSSENSPAIENTTPEELFEDALKLCDSDDNIEIPSKPTIKVAESLDLESPLSKQAISPKEENISKSNFDDPALTPESVRVEKDQIDEKEENINSVTDQILHMML